MMRAPEPLRIVPMHGGADDWRELMGEFQAGLSLRAGAKQVQTVTSVIEAFLWQAGPAWPDGDGATRGSIVQYLAALAGMGRSDKTILNHRSALATFCQFLADRGVIGANPCATIAVRRPEETLPRWLENDELRTVLALADAHGIGPEVRLALATGLRLSEMIRLRWADIDEPKRRLAIRKSKARRPRIVPLSQAALEALAEQRAKTGGPEAGLEFVFPARQTWRGGWRYANRPRASNWWRRALRPVQEAVPKFRELPGSSTGRGWHLFRHTFASRLAQAGVSLYKIAQWLGHSDIRTTKMYAHLAATYDPAIELAGNAKGESP